MPKGDPRGTIGAVVGYDSYSYQITTRGLEIYCGQPIELLQYGEGAELISELTAGIASEPGDAQPCPPYLLDDDTEAERAVTAIIQAMADDDSRAVTSARQQEQARKSRRKATKAARRRNR